MTRSVSSIVPDEKYQIKLNTGEVMLLQSFEIIDR